MVPSLLCTFVAHITFLHVFFLPPPFILSLSLFLSLSLYLCPLFLSVVARHMSSDALYQIFSSWPILLFHTISFHSSYKIHQLFTDYLLRLPSSELLEKHLFRSRANRRLVIVWCLVMPTVSLSGAGPCSMFSQRLSLSTDPRLWRDSPRITGQDWWVPRQDMGIHVIHVIRMLFFDMRSQNRSYFRIMMLSHPKHPDAPHRFPPQKGMSFFRLYNGLGWDGHRTHVIRQNKKIE